MKISNKSKDMHCRLIFTLSLVVILLLIGCAKPKNNNTDPLTNIKKSLFASIERPNIPVPEFKITDINGKVITNEEFKNIAYIVQGFTYGCSSCEHEVKTLNEIYSQYKDKGLEIITIDINGESNENVRDTKEKYNGGDWIWAYDTDNIGVKFGMKSLESTYLINKEGIIVYADSILTEPDVLAEEVKKVI